MSNYEYLEITNPENKVLARYLVSDSLLARRLFAEIDKRTELCFQVKEILFLKLCITKGVEVRLFHNCDRYKYEGR